MRRETNSHTQTCEWDKHTNTENLNPSDGLIKTTTKTKHEQTLKSPQLILNLPELPCTKQTWETKNHTENLYTKINTIFTWRIPVQKKHKQTLTITKPKDSPGVFM